MATSKIISQYNGTSKIITDKIVSNYMTPVEWGSGSRGNIRYYIQSGICFLIFTGIKFTQQAVTDTASGSTVIVLRDIPKVAATMLVNEGSNDQFHFRLNSGETVLRALTTEANTEMRFCIAYPIANDW